MQGVNRGLQTSDAGDHVTGAHCGWGETLISEIGFRTLRAHAALERAKRLPRSQ